ncbi:glycosyltransferase family 31 protein [Pseudohyphozyma bogoriensis]|nr:glycosyltransferase family 31 protein [Pseudohyphozyma bogoriensis]
MPLAIHLFHHHHHVQHHRASYISNDDLASLTLEPSPPSLYPDEPKSLCSSSTSDGAKRVAFCPIACLINCAAGADKELVASLQGPPGRPRIALKTYSVDTPSLQKKWTKVVNSFSASLQPLLSNHHHGGGGGVASFSPRSASPEREAKSSTSSLGLRYGDTDPDDDQSDDERFIPNPNNGRLNIRLPTLSRKPVRGRSGSTTDGDSTAQTRGILKSPDGQRSASPPLSSVDLDIGHVAAHVAANIHLAPRDVAALCVDPHVRQEWEETWSKGAKRKRKEDLKCLKEKEEQSEKCGAKIEKMKDDDGEGAEEDVPMCLGRLAGTHVDELGWTREEDEQHDFEGEETDDSPTASRTGVETVAAGLTAPCPASPPTTTSSCLEEPVFESSSKGKGKEVDVVDQLLKEVYVPPPVVSTPASPKPKRRFSLLASALGTGMPTRETNAAGRAFAISFAHLPLPAVPPSLLSALRNRVLLALAALACTIFLLFSSSSPFRSNARISPHSPFPSKGLKKELWTELNAIPWREFVIEPVEIPWSALQTPQDPVPWEQRELFAKADGDDSVGQTHPTVSSADKGGGSSPPVPKHRLQTYPLQPHLPKSTAPLDRFMFGIVTTIERAEQMSGVWGRWLTPPNEPNEGRPACLILLSQEENDEDIRHLRETIKQRGLPCGIKISQQERYEVRVLSMTVEMRDYAAELGRTFDWYIFNDDDTFWLDQRILRRMLSKYDPRQDWLVGTVSEAKNQLESFGRMAFGGAGLLISDTLELKLYNLWDTCWEKWKHIFGGDEMITRCAALALGKTKQTVATLEPGLHQFDIPGDTTGVFQSGIPLLNLHHFIGGSWVHLFGYGSYKTDFEQIVLLRKVLDFLGGDNMFRRYVFGDGKWLLTQGYSITRFEEPLKPEQLRKVEHTWYEGYRLTLDDRPVIEERHDWSHGKVKQTFYIDDIKVLGPSSAILTYVMADKWDEHFASNERVRTTVVLRRAN